MHPVFTQEHIQWGLQQRRNHTIWYMCVCSTFHHISTETAKWFMSCLVDCLKVFFFWFPMWLEANVNFEYYYWHGTGSPWKAITWLPMRLGSQYCSVNSSQITCTRTVVQQLKANTKANNRDLHYWPLGEIYPLPISQKVNNARSVSGPRCHHWYIEKNKGFNYLQYKSHPSRQ